MNKPSALAAGAAALLMTACVGLQHIHVPEALKPGADQALAMTVAAIGAQVYECKATLRKGAVDHEWVFLAPEADLFDKQGQRIGHHGASPYWQAADGSQVRGTLEARADAPIAGAIAWLLLSTRASGPEGRFSRVTSIQRVNTLGGVPPALPCAGDNLGRSVRVAYSADYHLYRSQR